MSFGGLTITRKGLTLQAKHMMGETITFTKIRLGDGEVGALPIGDLNTVVHSVLELNLDRLQPMPDGQISVGGYMKNSGLANGFYWREIGLYANDPTLGEILYAYDYTTTPELIPAGGAVVLERRLDLVIQFLQAENVSAVINQSLVYALKSDMESIQSKLSTMEALPTTEGTVPNYTANIPDLLLGVGTRVTVKFHAAANVISTLKINNEAAGGIKKPDGADWTKIKAGVYTLVFDGANFILQGEGGEYGTAGPAETLSGFTVGTENGVENGTLALTGDAGAGDVLLNKTFYNTNAKSKGTGTMPNRGSVGTINLTTEGAEYVIPAGYHNGLGKVKAVISGLIASVIKAGVTVGGIAGTFTADATSTAGQILTGKTAYVNGVKITGSMIDRRGADYAATVVDGTRIAGRIYMTPSTGYYDELYSIYADDADFLAANIKAGVAIYGLTGTLAYNAPILPITAGDGYTIQDVSNSYYASVGGTGIRLQFTMQVAGSVRLSYVGTSTTSSHAGYNQVYKNDVAYSAQFLDSSNSPVTHTMDIPVAVGDKIQLKLVDGWAGIYGTKLKVASTIATPVRADMAAVTIS